MNKRCRLRTRERVYKDFKTKCLGKYHDLYVQKDTLLLVIVFKNFHNICLEVYELDPANFITAPRLAWQADLKKAKVKLIF